jgi:hypothetical protein
VSDSSTNIGKERYWENKLECVIDWKYTWQLPFTLKLDTKCCEMHWKILHNIYPTKILLEKMGIANNNKCNSCNQIEFIEKKFATCEDVKPLWLHVEQTFNAIQGHRVYLTVKDILLGYEHTNWYKYKTLNKLILVAKLSISKYKYGDYPNLILLFERECRWRNIAPFNS